MAQFNRHIKFVHYRGDDAEIISKISAIHNTEVDRTRKGEPSIKSAISSLQRAHTKLVAILRSNLWQWFITLTFDNVDYFILTKLIGYDIHGGLNFSSLHRLVLFEFPKQSTFLTQDYFRLRLKRLLHKHYVKKVDKHYFITDRGRDNVPNRKDDRFCRRAFSRWSRELRSMFPKMYYLSVPEYHGAGCMHFHVVVGGVSAAELGLVDSGLVLHHGKPIQRSNFNQCGYDYDLPSGEGAIVYNVSSWKIGFTTATEVRSSEAVTWYVGKYMSKANIDPRFYNKRRYYRAFSTKLPKVIKFGDCHNYCVGDLDDPLLTFGVCLEFYKPSTCFSKYNVCLEEFDLDSLRSDLGCPVPSKS